MDGKILIGALALQFATAPTFAAGDCAAHSGAGTAALVELYTSESCSSCPPADRWLGRLPCAGLTFAQAVPLAFHVPYWDYIGWTDAYASQDHAQRQSWLLTLNGRRTSYTPHFFVSGTEVPDWRGKLEKTIEKIGAGGTAASIEIGAALAGGDRLAITGRATSANTQARLFVVVTEYGLVTAVRAGENSGATLWHEHVVRRLLGPLPLGAVAQEVPLGKGWNPAKLRITAFVQDMRAGRVLQAVATARCVL